MTSSPSSVNTALNLPAHRTLYYGGAWHEPVSGRFDATLNPSTGQPLARVAVGNATDVDAAVEAAKRAYAKWRLVPAPKRGEILFRFAQLLAETMTRVSNEESVSSLYID